MKLFRKKIGRRVRQVSKGDIAGIKHLEFISRDRPCEGRKQGGGRLADHKPLVQ